MRGRMSNFLLMNRFVFGGAFAALVAICAAACSDSSMGDSGFAGSGVDCTPYVTCGTCTPVQGCGWCFNHFGGVCANDPNQCAGTTEFTWTWDPAFCPGVDASVVSPDAGTPSPESGAAESSAPESSAPESSTPETGKPETSTPSDGSSEASAD